MTLRMSIHHTWKKALILFNTLSVKFFPTMQQNYSSNSQSRTLVLCSFSWLMSHLNLNSIPLINQGLVWIFNNWRMWYWSKKWTQDLNNRLILLSNTWPIFTVVMWIKNNVDSGGPFFNSEALRSCSAQWPLAPCFCS